MLKRWFGRGESEETTARPRACSLAACANGCTAAVVRMDCEHPDASRLRGMGLFEGAFVRVLDSRNGMLLEVKGSRVALGASLASAITVLPLQG